MKKIHIHLKGGLGNQLFQYAFYLKLLNSGVRVEGFYENFKNDNYNRKIEIFNLLTKKPIVVNHIGSSTIQINSEDYFAVKNFLDAQESGAFLIDGYFQNLSIVNESKIEKFIKFTDSDNGLTAIHIRRNDYGHHGLLPQAYYLDALSELNFPYFYVFSDEPNFAKYFFSNVRGFMGVIEAKSENTVTDFLNISNFKNIIMANSSYSWFAAYISSVFENNKKIFYPSKWSLISNENPGFKDNWIKIQTDLISFK